MFEHSSIGEREKQLGFEGERLRKKHWNNFKTHKCHSLNSEQHEIESEILFTENTLTLGVREDV